MRTQLVSFYYGPIWSQLGMQYGSSEGCHVVYCTSFLMLLFPYPLQAEGQAGVVEGREAQRKSSYQRLRRRIKVSVHKKREGTQGCGVRAGFLFCRRNGMESAPPPWHQSKPVPPPLTCPLEVCTTHDHNEVTPSVPLYGFPPGRPVKVRGV